MSENYYDIVIIGCGTSCGFLLSFLREYKFNNFPKILVIEKNSVPFKKILATGNGRCNFSNINITEENYYSFTADKNWQKDVFDKIVSLDLKKYFFNSGIFYTFDEYGRLFPYTKSAKTIQKYFIRNTEFLGVKLKLNLELLNVDKEKNFYVLTVCDKNSFCKSFIKSKILIFSSGGKAYPKLGSDGKCFEILKKLGHSYTDILCGIVPLVIEDKDLKILSGHKMDCAIKYKNFYREGEILFTDYGISGPNVLYVSNLVSVDLIKGKVSLNIDFLPKKSMSLDFYKKMFYKNPSSSLIEIFAGSLNENFITFISKKIFGKNFDIQKPIKEKDLEKFYFNVKNYKITVIKTTSFNDAQVTIGGIKCNEINSKNFESKICNNLYFMGEIIDYTGSCGGYNIHFCAASGKIVAEEIYKKYG